MSEKDDAGFRVVDRRASAAGTTDASTAASPDAPPADSSGAHAPGGSSSTREALPGIDFATFVISLSTSVMHHLGFVADPHGSATERNLPLARQTIDILEMLQLKTRGNLEPDEAHLIESLLYELRMRFVEASR